MYRLAFSAICVMVFSFFAATSFAVTIEYQLTPLGGNSYSYTYSVTNDGPDALQLFDIAFDVSLYDELSLEILSPSAISDHWQEVIFYSGMDGLAWYDAWALSGGIPVGSTVSGFTVKFDWLGDASGPGAQAFQIYDPQTFELLDDTGITIKASPEPSTLLLLGGGILGLLAWCRRTAR